MARARRAIGLDFGTSTTLLAERQDPQPATVVPLGRSTPSMPSLVASRGTGGLLVGEAADERPADEVVRSVKRAITEGRSTVPMNTADGPVDLSVAEAVTAILTEAATRARDRGTSLQGDADLRMGCPAMWTGVERKMLRDIAADTGLTVAAPELIDEPIAAGISWVWNRYLRRQDRVDGRTLVFDYGGGTLDIAVIDVAFQGADPEITVLSALGVGMAGDTLDNAILADLEAEWASLGVYLQELENPELAKALALRTARGAKVALSTLVDSRISLGRGFPAVPPLAYSRERLETIFAPQLRDAIQLTWAAIRAAKLRESRGLSREALLRLGEDDLAKGIDYVLIAGGMSQMPIVQRRLQEAFPKAQVETDLSLDSPDESVAAGLAFTSTYERLNLHRPGFDFVLEWTDPGGIERRNTLYSAHTPLYGPAQVLRGETDLGLRLDTGELGLEGGRKAKLKVVALDGTTMPLRIDGRVLQDFDVSFDKHQPLMMKLYVDGRLLISSGDRREWQLRVEQWPVLRGAGTRELILRNTLTPRQPIDPMVQNAGNWRLAGSK
jgi:molecular chaperone DnaK (HSP70)